MDYKAIISTVLVTIVTGLASWLTSFIIKFINSKITENKNNFLLKSIGEIVSNTVNALNQTFVAELKKEGTFDKAKAEEVKNKCVETVKTQLSIEAKDFIENTFGDLEDYISVQIEAYIYNRKG